MASDFKGARWQNYTRYEALFSGDRLYQIAALNVCDIQCCTDKLKCRYSKNEMNTRQTLDDLGHWYNSLVGESLKTTIASQLGKKLAKLGVQDVLFLGVAGFEQRLNGAGCQHTMFFTDVACEHLLANEDSYLPIKSESQQCVVLLHGLDVSINPHAVLREMSRVVTRDGYLVIVGFNRWSILGVFRPLLRMFNWRAQRLPRRLRFYGLSRLTDWLELLGFETGKILTMGYRPPIQNDKLYRWLNFLETTGRILLGRVGNVYLCIARKRTIPVTPEPMISRLRAGLIKAGLPKTSTEGV